MNTTPDVPGEDRPQDPGPDDVALIPLADLPDPTWDIQLYT